MFICHLSRGVRKNIYFPTRCGMFNGALRIGISSVFSRMRCMQHFKIIVVSLSAILLIGCTQGGGKPQFITPSENSPAYSVSGGEDSAVNEELAKEAGIIHLIYHVGPVDLPAETTLDTMLEHPLTMKFQVDEPLWIMGFKPKVIDNTGSELPAELLHHAIVLNEHEENTLCSEGTVGNPFIAATSTLKEINLPQGYGYPVLPTDPLEAKVVLYNPTAESYVDVSFELDIIAKPMNEFAAMQDVKPMLLDINPCTHEPMRVEPEQFVKQQATFTMQNGGNLLVGHALLQNYASYAELFKGTEVMPFWRTDAVLDDNHNVVELENDPFEDPAGINFKKGDTITMGVAYDNTKTSWIKGANAAAMIYFAMDEE